MGQYYKAIILRPTGEHEVYNSWDYRNGAKLMEHSYYGNVFVETVMKSLESNPGRLFWMGDYAEPDDIADANPESEQFFQQAMSLYGREDRYKKVTPITGVFSDDMWFINHTKRLVVYSGNVSVGLHLHPIPLLTSVGNGKGGGDFNGGGEDECGSWAGDIIELRATLTNIEQEQYGLTSAYFEE